MLILHLKYFQLCDNHDSNAKKIIESEVILIEQSLMASGFSEQNAFCLIGGLGKLFLPFLRMINL